MFDTLVTEPSTFLLCGAFLTHIFRKFKIDLVSETNVVTVFLNSLIDHFFDRSYWKHLHHNLLFLFIIFTEPPSISLLLLLMPFIALGY